MTTLTKRYYIANEDLAFREDKTHECKSHRSLSIEQVPARSHYMTDGKLKRTRQPVSKTLCAFLNSAEGGTIYLGVMDEGNVIGLKLSIYQKDHIILNLKDLCDRFTPPVPYERISLKFVPVFLSADKPEEMKLKKHQLPLSGDEADQRKRPHALRTSEACWCDREALDVINRGYLVTSFVIEICVKPFIPPPEAELCPELTIPPVYLNEEGLCYMRRTASNVQVNLEEALKLNDALMLNAFLPKMMKDVDEKQKKRGGEKKPLDEIRQEIITYWTNLSKLKERLTNPDNPASN